MCQACHCFEKCESNRPNISCMAHPKVCHGNSEGQGWTRRRSSIHDHGAFLAHSSYHVYEHFLIVVRCGGSALRSLVYKLFSVAATNPTDRSIATCRLGRVTQPMHATEIIHGADNHPIPAAYPPVRSRIHPIQYGPTKPPTIPHILIVAIASAAAFPLQASVSRVISGPWNAIYTGTVSSSAIAAAGPCRLSPANSERPAIIPAGIMTCHRLSPVRSELIASTTIAAAPASPAS